MFTGIVEEIGTLLSRRANSMTFKAQKVLENLETGDSIAVNGICLTAVSFDKESFTVEVMPETLSRSNLGLLAGGSKVNLERALTLTRPLGGHFVQGHVDGTGRIKTITRVSGATIIRLFAPPYIMRYIVDKGFIAIDGISLTVVECANDEFMVSIVGHSLSNTTLGNLKTGDIVNLEVDILAKYTEKFLTKSGSGISKEFLAEHGFSAE